MTTATFTITLNAASTATSSLDYTTQADTAAAGADFTAAAGTLTFAPGQTVKTITVPVLADPAASINKKFKLLLSNPVHCTLPTPPQSECIVSTGSAGAYFDRFAWIYGILKDPTGGYWGPPTGPKARTVPYHSIQNLIVEAPDWGHESVSETASFWARLEAWKIAMTGDAAGYTAMWASVEANFIPSATNQPVGVYTPASPATYAPEGDLPSAYPTAGDATVISGADPLATALEASYGNKRMYLMHWFWDVDGAYGFKNGDGTTLQVAVNSFNRGMQESSWETVTAPEWEDWTQGGNAYGFLPIFGQGLPTYPAAPFDYSKQWRYTCAPDAEARLISASFWADKFATAQSVSVAPQNIKAKRMGDYLRYALYDKYFRAVPGYDGSGAHNLVSWYVAWGGEIPTPPAASAWGFRIGSSESHFGYNGVDIAYMMATSGEGYSPVTAGAATQWQNSLARQLEMIRWLQSPEGPIAGGVSNSWKGRYETPTDGRQTHKFYGLYYTYSPVWHDPPSNNWFGFQAWGLERVAGLYLMVAAKTGTFNSDLRFNCAVILDRWVAWLLDHATLVGTTAVSLPVNLHWVSATAIAGQTTTTPNNEGVYEYLPSLTWDSTGNYAAFWNASAVPNPTLHCSIAESGWDIGSASSAAQLLIQYAQAKRLSGSTLASTIPGSAHTVQQALTLAKEILDRTWLTTKSAKGFTQDETRADYSRYNDPIYLPPGYSGHMPNGDALTPGVTTFISMRSFMKTDPDWPKVQAHLDGGAAPVFRYDRFWHNCETAVGFAMLHKYFADVIY